MMTNCPTCHRSISSNARFCPHCGDDFVRFRKARLQGRLFFWTAFLFTFLALVCTFAAVQARTSIAPYTTPQEASQWATASLWNAIVVWSLALLFWACTVFLGSKVQESP